jgi:lysozyme
MPNSSPVSNVAQLIELHEDRVPSAYQDSLGYWTIGVGHLIDARKGGKLPDVIIDALYAYDLNEKRVELQAALPWLSTVDAARQAVLLDMAFNLGVPGLMKWPMFLGQVKSGEYGAAANNMRASLWAKQVKTRAVRDALIMETGQWPS